MCDYICDFFNNNALAPGIPFLILSSKFWQTKSNFGFAVKTPFLSNLKCLSNDKSFHMVNFLYTILIA